MPSAAMDAGAVDAVDAGSKPRMPAEDPKATPDDDADAATAPPTADPTRDAGVTKDQPTGPNGPSTGSTAPCDRALLRQKADTYLAAMASGEARSLNLHPAVRYTENGRDEMLGGGVWARRANIDFARHVLDEQSCTTVTQAVLSARSARIVFGVRLLYQDGQLLEAEAQVVPDNLTSLIDIESLIPDGNDPWAEPVPEAMRSTRAELLALARLYFDAATSGSDVPRSAPSCMRRQNGAPLGNGQCNVPPGSMRFQQQRLPAIDETLGVVTAIVLYDDHIGQYMLRVIDGVTQSIEITGGATSSTTGW